MTYKQIIIDGCDVNECEFRFRTYGCDCMSSNRETKVLTEGSRCADNPNCYYKQLKRKEQECEELKKQLIKCDDNIIVDCEYSKKDLCSFIHRKKEVINGLQQQLDQLKAENVELKKWKETVVELFERTCRCKYLNEENNHCGFYNRKCIGRLNQCLYKNQQALTEIKEIAEKCRSSLYGYDQERYPKQILQKISEVKDES